MSDDIVKKMTEGITISDVGAPYLILVRTDDKDDELYRICTADSEVEAVTLLASMELPLNCVIVTRTLALNMGFSGWPE